MMEKKVSFVVSFTFPEKKKKKNYTGRNLFSQALVIFILGKTQFILGMKVKI